MKKPHLNGVNFNGVILSENSEVKDNLIAKTKETNVSFFNSVTDKTPKEISITEALSFIKSDKYFIQLSKIRETIDKKQRDHLKKQLPCITVSGVFKNGHSSKDLIKHSGLIQIDLDEIENPEKVKAILINDSFIYSCFISPSGNGVKAIVKINFNNHLRSFDLVKDYFYNEYKLQIDNKCKDLGRLMYLSYDNELFINEYSLEMNETSLKIKSIIRQIETKEIDITESYDNWYKVGFALANEFKESGRELFHKISKQNLKYNYDQCNNQFDVSLKSGDNRTTIGTFFFIASQYDIQFENQIENKNELKQINFEDAQQKTETSKFKIVENYLNTKYDFRYNKVSNEVEIKSKIDSEFQSINDNNLYRHLQHQNINFSQNNLTALLRSDFVSEYDPIKNYFENLYSWDCETDHISNLCNFVKAKDQERFNKHFKKMLVRCVACSLGHAFNKQAFILMGGQSSGKTTFFRELVPKQLKPYYTEHISTDKDSLISLTENFIINLDELATMERRDINTLKSMLSKDTVKVRKPYDKKPTISKRRANFFGSTNKDEFLSDETGSVRWLCFEIHEIDWSYSNLIDIDLIWSQAFYLFKNGFEYNLTSKEIEENEKVNSNHTIRTAELDLIQRYFEPIDKENPFAKAYTSTDIINELKSYNITQLNITPVNIGKALRHLGYKPISQRIGESKMPVKVYYMIFKFQESATTLTTPTTRL